MTDRRPDRPAPPQVSTGVPAGAKHGKPGFMPTILLSLASFAVIFEFLVFQLNSGNDPALGERALAAGSKRVTDRRNLGTGIVQLPAGTRPVVPAAPAPTPVSPPVTSSS